MKIKRSTVTQNRFSDLAIKNIQIYLIRKIIDTNILLLMSREDVTSTYGLFSALILQDTRAVTA